MLFEQGSPIVYYVTEMWNVYFWGLKEFCLAGTETPFPPSVMELKILTMESLEHEMSHIIILPGWALPFIFEALNQCLRVSASNKKTHVFGGSELPRPESTQLIQVQKIETDLQISSNITVNHSQTSLFFFF